MLLALVMAASGLAVQHQYTSMDEAATDGLRQSFKLSNRYEYAGAIYKWVGGNVYFISLPHTDENETQVGNDYEAYVRFKIVGIYHTHPCPEGGDNFAPYFSQQDQHVYTDMKWYGYMADMCTGHVHKYKPDVPVAFLKAPERYRPDLNGGIDWKVIGSDPDGLYPIFPSVVRKTVGLGLSFVWWSDDKRKKTFDEVISYSKESLDKSHSIEKPDVEIVIGDRTAQLTFDDLRELFDKYPLKDQTPSRDFVMQGTGHISYYSLVIDPKEDAK